MPAVASPSRTGLNALSELLVASLAMCRDLGQMDTADHVLNALRVLHGREGDPSERLARGSGKE
jgi:hypothetical protein